MIRPPVAVPRLRSAARRWAPALAGAVLAALILGTAAEAAKLRGSAFGVVDHGDRLAFTVAGKGCAKVRARVVLRFGAARVRGPRARGCRGVARVPRYGRLARAGWQPGTSIVPRLRSRAGTVPLRWQRAEAEAAAGELPTARADDQDTGGNDLAVTLNPGEALPLGRVNLRRIDSIALRLCLVGADASELPNAGMLLTPDRLEPTTLMSLRQDAPDGPSLLGPTDVSSGLQELSRYTSLGFGGCYRLVALPLTGRVLEDAPELYLRVESGVPGTLRVNSVDFNGTGARLAPRLPRNPPGMEVLFDGTSFDGFTHADCDLRDGAAVNARTADDTNIAGCTMTTEAEYEDVVVRVRVRRENFYDNGGIYFDDQEIQLRSAGEYLPGGYFNGFSARWQKLVSFPQYSTVEIVQLGARHVITVNGRTVTDHMRAGGPPEPYNITLVTQPNFSYRTGAETGFGNEGAVDTTKPSELGALWFDDLRVLDCDGPDDPVCKQLANARRGQVPVPDGA